MVVMPESTHSRARAEALAPARDLASVPDRAWDQAAAQELALEPSEERVPAWVRA